MIKNTVSPSVLEWEEIKQNIRGWNMIRHSADEVKPFFTGETYFEFQAKPDDSQDPIALHFYPAVVSDNELALYIIRTEFDKKEVYEKDKENFANKYISVAPLRKTHVGGLDDLLHGITRENALKRIHNWDRFHPQWMDATAPTLDGIFAAFYMTPSSNQDLREGLRGFFGLKGTASPFDFKADLILQNIATQRYFNTVRPVPPYPSEEPETSFFLLTAATNP